MSLDTPQLFNTTVKWGRVIALLATTLNSPLQESSSIKKQYSTTILLKKKNSFREVCYSVLILLLSPFLKF